MENLQLVFNVTADQWTSINKRAYLLSVRELGGVYYNSFLNFSQVDELCTASKHWIATDFNSISSNLQNIINISGILSGLIVSMSKALAANSSQAANIAQLNSAISSIGSLSSGFSTVQANIDKLTTLNSQADLYIQTNNAAMWQSLLSDYGWGSATQAYSNVTQALEGMVAGWIELGNDITTEVLAPLNSSLSDENQKKAIDALTEIGKTVAGWDVVVQNASNAITVLQGQGDYTSGEFLYSGSPVTSGATYAMVFSGTSNYMLAANGNIISTGTNFNAGNSVYEWTFQKTQAGFYYLANKSLPGQVLSLLPAFNLDFQASDPNNCLCQYFKLRHMNGDGPNDWHLTCADLLYSYEGNNLSLSGNDIQVGQTSLFGQNPEILEITPC
jgi:hypothetical protein